MLPDVIKTFIENEYIPITQAEARAIWVAFKGDVWATLSALREYEANSYRLHRASIEAKAREVNAQLALRARERTGADVIKRPIPKRTYSQREIEEELLA